MTPSANPRFFLHVAEHWPFATLQRSDNGLSDRVVLEFQDPQFAEVIGTVVDAAWTQSSYLPVHMDWGIRPDGMLHVYSIVFVRATAA